MKMNILTLAISVTVGIILVGSLLAPVISEASEPTYQDYSNGTEYWDKVTTDCTIIATPSGVTLNGNALESSEICYMISKDIALVYLDNAVKAVTSTGIHTVADTYTLTFSNGVLTETDGTDTNTYEMENIWLPSSTPTDWVIMGIDAGAYVSGLNDITTFEYSYDAYTYVTNGVITRNPSTTGGTLGGTLNQVDGVDGVYKLTGLTITLVEYPDATAPFHDPVIVPAKISIVIDDKSDIAPILGAIIPIIIASILLGAVGVVVSKNRD